MGLEPTKRNKKMMKAYEDLEARILPSNTFPCTNFSPYLVPFFFWSSLFLEARAEILKKIVGFLVATMTSKSAFEINWPLG